jgi:hypothetical protein
MKGIVSYKHLNQIIIEVLKNTDDELTAAEINDIILNKYKVGKIRVNPLRIAKRIKGNKNIESRYGPKGLFVYRHLY